MQENTTYYDDTRYDNLTSLESKGSIDPSKLSSKLAKLSALDKVRNNINKIKSELNDSVETEPATKENETSVEMQPETSEVTPEVSVQPTAEVEPQVEQTQNEEPAVEYPSKESLQVRTEGISFYNNVDNSSSNALGRKLRVAPQVTNSMKYTLNTLGVDYVAENIEEKPTAETELDVSVETEMPSTETPVEPEITMENSTEDPQTFDFSALPGVGDATESTQEDFSSMYDQSAYEDHMTMEEQDNRLNDYLNRDTSMDISSSVNADLEEIRRLKKEIEDAKRSLQQVKGNVIDLQQKDSKMSEQLAMLKQELIAQKDAVNQEILAETTEWNNLTQLVKEKEALMSGEEELLNNKMM